MLASLRSLQKAVHTTPKFNGSVRQEARVKRLTSENGSVLPLKVNDGG